MPFPGGQQREVTMEQFLDCLDRADANGDGLISQRELQNVLRLLGLRFSGWKAWRAMANSDRNGNGHIDTDAELRELVEFARKNWGFIVK